MKGRAYLDHNATSPLRPEARAAMIAAMDVVGNPSSVHAEGRAARKIVEDAREQIAAVLFAAPKDIIFTSGGTDAACLMIAHSSRWIVGATEHPCILQSMRELQSAPMFGEYAIVPVSTTGIIDLSAMTKLLPDFAGLAIQYANNETGVIQPWKEISCRAGMGNDPDCIELRLSDCVQAVGRLPLDFSAPKIHTAFFSAHKFGGPKGVGALFHPFNWFVPVISGGGQERGRRAGTENVIGIAGMAAALKAAVRDQDAEAQRLGALRYRLETGIRDLAPDAVILGEGAPRLPNTTCYAVPGITAETALIAFDLDGVSVSSGSACSSGKVAPSHVLKAMGVPDDLAACAIRVSTGWTTTDADIEKFLLSLSKLCKNRRALHAA